jgi:hypothetical protein
LLAVCYLLSDLKSSLKVAPRGSELGSDPQAEKSCQRCALGVSDLIDAFLEGHVGGKLKPKSQALYQSTLAKLRAAHGGVKAEALTRGQRTRNSQPEDDKSEAKGFCRPNAACVAIAASLNPKPDSIRQNSVIANLARAETGPESFVPQLVVADKSRLFAFDVSEVDFIPLAITMAYFAQA